MAGDWIKMRSNLAEDPAVIGMAAALDLDEDAVVGKLHRLWAWADSQSLDGHAANVTKKWIDRYTRVDGFADAMVSQHWLIVEKGGIRFPNFDRHNGKTAKERALTTRRQQIRRHGSVTNMSRDERDKTVTREEKRREEAKAQSSLRSDSPSADADGPPPATRKPRVAGMVRLRQITIDAVTAFNARLGRPRGLLPSVSLTVGMEKRQTQVKRCLKIASEICKQQYGDPRITPDFWESYWAEVDKDDFRSGRQPGGRGHENWTPSFEYLTRPAVMLEVFDRAVGGGE